jgi:hypothetical protein
VSVAHLPTSSAHTPLFDHRDAVAMINAATTYLGSNRPARWRVSYSSVRADRTSEAERASRLVDEFSEMPAVTTPGEHGFGRTALKVNGSLFAMLPGDQLVVKLPRHRVAELIAARRGHPFDASRREMMSEWLCVDSDHAAAWRELAREAYDYVRSTTSAAPPTIVRAA